MDNNQSTLPFSNASSVSHGAKRCVKCGETKPLTAFRPRFTKTGKLSYRGQCRACRNAAAKAELDSDPSKRQKTRDANNASGKKRRKKAALNPLTHVEIKNKHCAKCKTSKPPCEFYRNITGRDGLSWMCIPCTNEVNRSSAKKRRTKLRAENPKMLWALQVFGVRRQTAKKQDVPFRITAEYLASIAPDICPVLGTPLVFSREGGRGSSKPDSASVDKFSSRLGYVEGNVCVISHKANTLKSDGNVTEIAKVLAWMLTHASVSDEERDEVYRVLGMTGQPKDAA